MPSFRDYVSAHPQIEITPEAHWIPRLFEKRKGLTPEGRITSKLIPRHVAERKFAMFQLGREELTTLLWNGAEPQPSSAWKFLSAAIPSRTGALDDTDNLEPEEASRDDRQGDSPGRRYAVDCRTNLNDSNGTPVVTNTAGTGGILSVTNSVGVGQVQRFYRAVLLP